MENLEYKGRDANHELNFRQWNRSKSAQYFTPIDVSNAIFNGLKRKIKDIKKIKVLDPAAGSGRLLVPWKRAEANIIGIELDEEAGRILKHNIGSKNSRIGDLLKYAEYLEREDFNLVLTNPPYGIVWDTEGIDYQFETKRYGGKIESQSATLEIAIKSLEYEGLLIAIIPTSTFANGKDNKIIQFFHSETELLARLTMDNMFKDEYGINVQVDIVAAMRTSGYNDRKEHEPVKAHINSFKEISSYLDELDIEIQSYYRSAITVPDISNLINYQAGNNLEINISGVSGNLSAINLVDFYDATMETYNPVIGCRTGIKEAYLSTPALISEGTDKAIDFFKNLGFNTVIPDNTKLRLKKLKEKYDRLLIPLFPIKSHQLLAYFKDKPYTAIETIRNDKGKVLFQKGKTYAVRPCWIRNMNTVKVENIKDSKGKQVRKTTSLDRGYLSIDVKSEQGDIRFNEPDKEGIRTFIKAFGLPEVKNLDEVMPETIKQYHKKLERAMPQLFEYQLHDLARLCCKPFGYIGYEMGGGKTLTAISYCLGRGTKWNLIICQSSLISNWLNEGKKFGVRIESLTTHTAIDKLKREKRKWQSKDKKDLPVRFFVTSYEFLSLDTAREYDPWQCIQTNKDGKVIHSETSTKRCCSKGHTRNSMVKACPKCNDYKKWTGAYCHTCGYRAYQYKGIRQYPGYKRISKLFSSICADEAQLAKNVSGRGLAVRAMKGKCRLILSGTIQRGFVTDVYFNFGYLLGHSNPLFPYPRKGGSGKFLNEFGTFQYVSTEFEDTLTTGRRKILPEVSNLNRFWRILSAFTVRRLKDEMVELPPKHKDIMLLDMDAEHKNLYAEYSEWAKKLIDKELRKPESEINMGIISRCLWALRFASTAPNDSAHLSDKGPGRCLERRNYNKISKIVELVKEIQDKKEKVVIFSGLRSMVWNIEKELQKSRIKTMKITASIDCKKRFGMISEYQNNGYVALVSGLNVLNRGYTITKANHVIITDLEYQPESSDQAEDRVHRTGQTKPVHVTYLLSKGTIDETMLEIITQKREAISHSINGQAKYASTAELLKQMDNRRIELAVAREVLKQKTDCKPVQVISNIESVIIQEKKLEKEKWF
ncbi:MAG: SNF2-related protein, partial [bacterium]